MRVPQEHLLLWAFGDFVCLCILFSLNTTPFKKIIAPKDSGRIIKGFVKYENIINTRNLLSSGLYRRFGNFTQSTKKIGSQTLLPVGNYTPPWSFVLIHNSINFRFVNTENKYITYFFTILLKRNIHLALFQSFLL